MANFLDDRLPLRFWNKCIPEPMSGCWLWIAGKTTAGYAHYGIATNTMRYGHRVSYEALVGPIPSGLTIDHKCRVRCCVNPMHLEPVTNQVNSLRGIGPTAVNAAKQACPKCGGEYRLDKRGARYCAECRRAGKRVKVRKPYLRWKAYVTHCPRGHAYEGDNVYRNKHGHRICRACNREKQRERAEERKRAHV